MKLLLSIDGGGAHILIAAKFLALLEDLLHVSIYDKFDCYAGTSSGSLMIGLIAYSKLNANNILANVFSMSNLQQIFHQRLKNRLCSGTLFPLYTGIGKSVLIRDHIDNITVSDTEKDVLVTAYDINSDVMHFFKSYLKKISNNKLENDTSSIQLAVDASSAATTYFPPVNVSGIAMMDGAVGTNNPTDCIYADLLKMYPKEDIKILSIGITKYDFNKNSIETMRSWGSLQWLLQGSIISRLTAVDSPLVDYRMKSFSTALGHAYMRVIPKNTYNIPIDVADELNYNKLLNIGEEMFNDNLVELKKFFEIS